MNDENKTSDLLTNLHTTRAAIKEVRAQEKD